MTAHDGVVLAIQSACCVDIMSIIINNSNGNFHSALLARKGRIPHQHKRTQHHCLLGHQDERECREEHKIAFTWNSCQHALLVGR